MTTRSHRAYAATQRETSVSSAKPVELVAMVYKRLLDHLHTGKIQMSEGADSAESLTKAIDLITTGLESCLDKEKGGEIAQNLAFIYDWAGKEIIRARLRRDPEMLQGVINAFVPLAEAWLEHAGQKDDSFASKYLKPAMNSVQVISGNAAAGMGAMFAGTAAVAATAAAT
jgi:flagellar protein FliS